MSAPEHVIITGQQVLSIRLAEPVTTTGPKTMMLGTPDIAADLATLTYVLTPEGKWRVVEMAAIGVPVDPEVGKSRMRRAWDRTSADRPPSWLTELARLHRPG